MTPDDTRREFYAEMAERLSPVYTQCDGETWLSAVSLDIETASRLAAHFGRLALGHVRLEEQRLIPTDPHEHHYSFFRSRWVEGGVISESVCWCGEAKADD